MKKNKKLIVLSLLITAGIFYISESKKELNAATEENAEVVEQQVENKTSSIKKEIQIEQNQESNETEENKQTQLSQSEKEKVIAKLVARLKPSKLNAVYEKSFSKFKNDETGQDLIEFVKSFPFLEEYQKEFAKLHQDDLLAILEIQQSPASQKLIEKQVQNQEKMMDIINNKKEYSNDPGKQAIIDQIMSEQNLMKSAQQSSKNIIETVLTYSLMKKNDKYSEKEARQMAVAKSIKIASMQSKNIKTAINISYGSLSHTELASHLVLLQKSNAKRVSKLSFNVADKVNEKFAKQIVKYLKVDSKEEE